MTTLEGHYLFVNKGWEQAFHKSLEQVRGKSLDQIVNAATAERFFEGNNRVIASEGVVMVEQEAETGRGAKILPNSQVPCRRRPW